MKIALAVLVIVLAIGAGFGAGWIAHDENSTTLACRDTRPSRYVIPLSGNGKPGYRLENPTAPLTMRCELRKS